MRLFLKLRFLPYLAFVLHRLLSFTWRVQTILSPVLQESLRQGQVVTLAHWHCDETVLVLNIRRLRAGILNSKSSDGQMMAKLVKLYGAQTAKGSSSRDGVEALKGLIRLAKSGRNPTVAVDGPRGPFKKIKPGVFQVSRLTQSAICPANVVYSSAWRFPKSWDQTYLPKPFARVLIYWGPIMPAVTKDQDPKSETLAQELTAYFASGEKDAVKLFKHSTSQC